MTQNRSQAEAAESVRNVWRWHFKSRSFPFDKLWQTHQVVAAIPRINWTWRTEINLLRSCGALVPSQPWSPAGRACGWRRMISVNKERRSDLITHRVWRRLHTQGSLIICLPWVQHYPARTRSFSQCCLGRSLPLSHPFNHPYSLRLSSSSLFSNIPFTFPYK